MIHVKLKIRIMLIIVRNIQSNRKIQIQSLYKMHKHIVIYLITQFIDEVIKVPFTSFSNYKFVL